jgi:hypothetical protein
VKPTQEATFQGSVPPPGRTETGLRFRAPGAAGQLLRFGDAPARATFDFETIADATFMRSLSCDARRLHLLVQCAPADVDVLVSRIVPWCVRPLHARRLPGPLSLPLERAGTLLLRGVSALSVAQQIELYDWLIASHPGMQVVSVTSVPIGPLVEAGLFLQGLFDRLNTIQLNASRRAARRR